MKGIVLCGGLGTRLLPLTEVTNKHLLPVYNKPMVYYPIETLINAGIRDIGIVVSGNYSGEFVKLLKNGEDFGLNKITYFYQKKPNGGIADALSVTKDFVGNDNVCVILGDNTSDINFSNEIRNFKHGCHLFFKQVDDPTKFGVPTLKDNKLIKITEKPKKPDSQYAVIGIYIYDKNVYNYIEQCSVSARNELEISDVNNFYIKNQNKRSPVNYSFVEGFWQDAGDINNLFYANQYWFKKHNEKKE